MRWEDTKDAAPSGARERRLTGWWSFRRRQVRPSGCLPRLSVTSRKSANQSCRKTTRDGDATGSRGDAAVARRGATGHPSILPPTAAKLCASRSSKGTSRARVDADAGSILAGPKGQCCRLLPAHRSPSPRPASGPPPAGRFPRSALASRAIQPSRRASSFAERVSTWTAG